MADSDSAPQLNIATAQSLHMWLQKLSEVPVGGVIDAQDVGNPIYVTDDFSLTPSDPFINAGFTSVDGSPSQWRREVRLDAAAGATDDGSQLLVLSDMPTLPNIDCIVISSISRKSTDQVYVYATLRSIFQEFPPEAHVNILVGNSDADYVSAANLTEQFGAEDAARVHVIPTPPDVADYLSGLAIAKRGGWNFARGLLKYRGSRGIIILEDDVEWAPGSPALLQNLTEQTRLSVMSLYNLWCETLGGRRAVATSGLLSAEVPDRGWGFQWFSQGFYVAAEFARPLGEHHLVHLNTYCWDKLVNYFLVAHNLDVAYTYPSVLQHRGRVSTGPWGDHASTCYLGDTSAVPDDTGGEVRSSPPPGGLSQKE